MLPLLTLVCVGQVTDQEFVYSNFLLYTPSTDVLPQKRKLTTVRCHYKRYVWEETLEGFHNIGIGLKWCSRLFSRTLHWNLILNYLELRGPLSTSQPNVHGKSLTSVCIVLDCPVLYCHQKHLKPKSENVQCDSKSKIVSNRRQIKT